MIEKYNKAESWCKPKRTTFLSSFARLNIKFSLKERQKSIYVYDRWVVVYFYCLLPFSYMGEYVQK